MCIISLRLNEARHKSAFEKHLFVERSKRALPTVEAQVLRRLNFSGVFGTASRPEQAVDKHSRTALNDQFRVSGAETLPTLPLTLSRTTNRTS